MVQDTPKRKRNTAHLTIRAYQPLASYSEAAHQLLAQWLDVDAALLAEVHQAMRSDDAYFHYRIPKPGRLEWRDIYEPYGALKEIQRRILDRLLYPIPVSNAAHGAVPGRSVVSNAMHHLPDAQQLLLMDLRNAFPSVRLPRVHTIFRRYVKPLFRQFGPLPHAKTLHDGPSPLDEALHFLAALTTMRQTEATPQGAHTVYALPQGAPTSGYLLNLACLEMDRKIFKIIDQHKELGLRYSRYIDDITISTPTSIPQNVQQELELAVIKNDFRLHRGKTRLVDTQHENAVICGVTLRFGRLEADPLLIERCQEALERSLDIADPRTEIKRRSKIRGIISFFKQVYGEQLPPSIKDAYQRYRKTRDLPDETEITAPAIAATSPRPVEAQDAVSLLAQWLDLSPSYVGLAQQLAQSGLGYDEWEIPKGNGKTRQISSPKSELKAVQERILDRLLYHMPVSVASHGFVPGRSIVTNAQAHLGAKHLLNLDLKDAFPSVSTARVKHVMQVGLGALLKKFGLRCPRELRDDVVALIADLTTHKNELPQGAPTSGYLLNLSCLTLDKRLFASLQEYHTPIVYTRYADDLTLSTQDDLPELLLLQVQSIIENAGFRWHPHKVHSASVAKGQDLEICGLRIDDQQIRIPREKIKTFRSVLRRAAAKIPTGQLDADTRNHVQGIVGFVKMVYGDLPHALNQPYQAFLQKHPEARPSGAAREKFALYPNILPE
ncbi:reverse transcriptase family protein [Myxococcota bacterium]|nr:reverse transcriptase family protein [Myxococcota bacterium]